MINWRENTEFVEAVEAGHEVFAHPETIERMPDDLREFCKPKATEYAPVGEVFTFDVEQFSKGEGVVPQHQCEMARKTFQDDQNGVD